MGKSNTNDGKVGAFDSIRFKLIITVFCALIIACVALDAALLSKTSGALKEVNQNYLYDIAVQTGERLNKEIVNNGLENCTDYESLAKIFTGMGIKGMSTSYIYVVSADGTMLYHPTESKVGEPVTNEVVKGVCADLAEGKKVEASFVTYVFKGASKYAAYYVTSDKSTVVVATVDEKEIMADLNSIVIMSIVIAVLVIVISMIIVLFVANAIIKPINKVTAIIGKNGDLDFTESPDLAALVKRKDEVGVMSRAVATMTEKISGVILSLQEQSTAIKQAAAELNTSSRDTANTVEQVEKAVSEIADGANSQAEETQKATENVILMGNMVEETNSEVDKLTETANEMKKSGEEAILTLDSLEKINSKAKASIDVIYEQTNTTNVSANKIREATSIITSIAEETNLLSLNASIEAARAGEQGRGFAVVASQISKLAEQSNESARQIETITELLITDSSKAVETMNEVQDIMKEQSEKVSQTSQMFGEVKTGIESSINGITTIAGYTKRLDDARIVVVDVVQNLTAIAEENAASTEETSASVTEVSSIVYDISQNANKLDGISEELQQNISMFTL
ncbi:MAG: methyl-accepting chemotaxis protein [Lachnospiraceae bacterium]|nr:methyl-accepting chemotaxis protein [Lachnospiraceae bacterium]